MTGKRSAATLMVVMIALLGRTSGASAQEEGATPPVVLSPDSRVRGLDREAVRLLATAGSCSPTVAPAVTSLQATDLIVGIEAWPLSKTTAGDLRIVASATGVRYLRVRLRVPGTPADLIAVLGHELQHAREVAAAPEVMDLVTQCR